MKEVKIDYSFLFFFRKTKTIRVPEEWSDLNSRQFAVCSRIFVEAVPDITFISEFFGIKKALARRTDKFCQYKLIELAGFVSNPKAVVNFFYLAEIRGTGLLCPEKKLNGVTMEQFSIFDTLFFDYINDPKETALCRFIAVLYLKEGEKATQIDFASRVDFIARKMDKTTQYAIFLNYTFIRKWLSKTYPLLFGFEEAPEKHTGKVRAKKPNRPDWNSILDGLVGDDIIHYEQYRQIPCIIAFRTINKRIQTYNKNGK